MRTPSVVSHDGAQNGYLVLDDFGGRKVVLGGTDADPRSAGVRVSQGGSMTFVRMIGSGKRRTLGRFGLQC